MPTLVEALVHRFIAKRQPSLTAEEEALLTEFKTTVTYWLSLTKIVGLTPQALGGASILLEDVAGQQISVTVLPDTEATPLTVPPPAKANTPSDALPDGLTAGSLPVTGTLKSPRSYSDTPDRPRCTTETQDLTKNPKPTGGV